MLPRRTFADQPLNLSSLPSFRAEHFPYSGPYPWLDRDDSLPEIAARRNRNSITEAEAELCRCWTQNGYVILPNLIDPATLDSVWAAYEKAIRNRRITLLPEPAGDNDPYPGRYLNPHKKIGAFCQLLKHPDLLQCLRLFMEREPKPLQTIAAHKGSQQGLHSDSIHMTTYPLGYLSAAWIAFEDIHPDSGPLVYYPGSHRLPYVFSKDVGITEQDFKQEGYKPYHARYEPHIKELVESHHIEPRYFHAKKGDVLIWHANLIHGGSPRNNLQLSRRSVVCHFFVKNAFVYHDLAAAKSRQQYIGTCLLRDETGNIKLF
ncbi:MAG TPA: phytanoyl-CoA dioxygenase family protein [Bryobacteraceae bacterium]|nr:phytanoyl-CoA dioxygenase family protein [Bryobacteraceae bacterium]